MGRVVKRSRWVRKYAQYVQSRFCDFKTSLKGHCDVCYELTIFNPHIKDRDINVCLCGNEATLFFSFVHVHFEYEDEDIEQLIDYMNKFISSEYAAFQFYKDGKFAMSGSQRSKDVDLTNIQSILKTFIPDLNANQIEKRALTLSEVLPCICDGHNKKISDCVSEARKKQYECFRTHEYKLGVECWNGKNDMYKRIYWDGYDFRIKDITEDELHE